MNQATHTIQRIAEDHGIPIVDAKKHREVVLTNRDISRSSMKDPTSCAFAKACNRDDQVVGAFFFLTTAYLQFSDRIERYTLPPSMRAEIVAFDRGGPKAMEAGIYRLSPIRGSKRLGKKTSQSVGKKGNGRKRKVHRMGNVRKLEL